MKEIEDLTSNSRSSGAPIAPSSKHLAEILGLDSEAWERFEWSLLMDWDVEKYAAYPLVRPPKSTVHSDSWAEKGTPRPENSPEVSRWQAMVSRRLSDNRAVLAVVLWQLLRGTAYQRALGKPHPKLDRHTLESAKLAGSFGVVPGIVPQTLDEAHRLCQAWDWDWAKQQIRQWRKNQRS